MHGAQLYYVYKGPKALWKSAFIDHADLNFYGHHLTSGGQDKHKEIPFQ